MAGVESPLTHMRPRLKGEPALGRTRTTFPSATVSQAAQQARVAWPDMTSDLVQSLDSRWGITSARLLRQGDRGEDVKALQKKLGVTADGIFGPDTAKAVKALQKKHGLTVDGIVGPKTLAALK